MATQGMYTITNNWIKLDDLFTVDPDKTYMIHNRGPASINIGEADSAPTNEDYGVKLEPDGGMMAVYHKSSGTHDLYLKANGDNARLYINYEG